VEVVVQTAIADSTLREFEREAAGRASARGHALGVFRTSMQDPLRYVSFCHKCRSLVIIDLEGRSFGRSPRFYGYALEGACGASPFAHPRG
jgi:hypothetical protein